MSNIKLADVASCSMEKDNRAALRINGSESFTSHGGSGRLSISSSSVISFSGFLFTLLSTFCTSGIPA
ncbi:MAG: hypothetical protein WBK26_12400 [Burkholderiaceae bacterium]